MLGDLIINTIYAIAMVIVLYGAVNIVLELADNKIDARYKQVEPK